MMTRAISAPRREREPVEALAVALAEANRAADVVGPMVGEYRRLLRQGIALAKAGDVDNFARWAAKANQLLKDHGGA